MLTYIRHEKITSIVPFFIILVFSFILLPFNILGQEKYNYKDTILIPNQQIASKDEFNSININQLISIAHTKKLSQSNQWWSLLHYKKTIFGIKSLVDDPKFFLAPNGKYDPESELDATIRYLFSYNESENPVTRFMARYQWLKKELNVISPHEYYCEKYKEITSFKDNISVQLVFPTGYINSPASMFGHTLLTVQSQYNPGLLSSAINYAANTNESFGPLFAFRGIFGFYKGYFSIMPYYLKVQEYSDLESRDIWEYKLNLDQDEVRFMLFHIWELDNVYSDYYFFDENCSFNLLYLLEVTRPDSHLTDDFFFWVIPIDTIRKVINAGFVEKTSFRPSRVTTINYLLSQLDGNQVKAVKSIVNQKNEISAVIHNSSFTQIQKIQILDCASELIQYRYTNKEYTQKEYQDIFINVLKIRSSIANTLTYTIPPPPKPETGHYSSNVQVHAGRFEKSNYSEFVYRPSYHDLCDDPSGFIPGSQIIFGETALRYYYNDDKLYLQRLELINIESLSPINQLIKPLSWKVITGFYRIPIENNNKIFVYQLNTGSGYTIDIFKCLQIYGMIEFSGLINKSFNNNIEIGPGFSIGILFHPFQSIRIRSYMMNTYYLYGQAFNFINVRTILQYNLNQRFSTRFEILNWHDECWYNQFSGALTFYFW
ncbi:MAG: DUF4105 domain-containing protein [Spirochaetes bacterium]|nr:DUF4105 domain-containing protein [Spirochaetota bacterium]